MLTGRQHERIEALLDDCDRYLPRGAVFIDVRRAEPARFGGRFCPFCRCCLEDTVTTGYCRSAITAGAYQALQTGEPYFFRCWVGLNSVVFPVAPAGRLEGAVEMGGFFYAGQADEDRGFVTSSLHAVRGASPVPCRQRICQVPMLSALETRGMASFVFEGLFSAGINSLDVFEDLHEKYLQQRRIAELMQDLGPHGVGETDFFALFAALDQALERGDRRRTMLLMDGFFGRVMLASSLNIEQMKAHVHLLLAFLVRESVVRHGQDLTAALGRHLLALRELERQEEVADICHWTSKRVSLFLDSVGTTGQLQQPSLSARTRVWLERNHGRRLTLRQAARQIGASASSIAQALRRDTQMSFHEHLTDIRLGESRRLLTFSDLSLAEIAYRCGFCDQSHFTRVFRTGTGVTPARFRRL
ncbi:MAG: helix-turn-helix domain-containing protein, partial [Lentisphaeria bacterium]|nr:helix-turn-helix domain-containing protein [Lentisphaeria bacterium]